MVYPSLKLSAFNIFKMDLHVLVVALPNIITSPVLKSLHWLKVEQRIKYKIIFITHNLLHITEPKYLHWLMNIKPPSRTSSSDHRVFPRTCFHQAQVCWSIISQLLSPLMELSTNKSKIICPWYTSLHHSHQLYSFLSLQSNLSFS